MREAVTQEDSQSRLMVEPVQALRELRVVKYPVAILRRDADRKQVWKLTNPHWREKLLLIEEAPVPQTDTGR